MATYLSPNAIPGVKITLNLNGQQTNPAYGYVLGTLGVLPKGTKITIIVEVENNLDHSCYTLNYAKVHIAKAAVRPGVYVKNLTVIPFQSEYVESSTQIAGWPNNMLCLDIEGKTYNIGIFNRMGKYFFCIHERISPIETNSALPIGFVTHFDPLCGIGRIYNGSIIQDAKLHWSRMPFRPKLGFRAVVPGEVVKFTPKDVRETGAENTTYSQEIMRCTI